jgi:hypothetical protein
MTIYFLHKFSQYGFSSLENTIRRVNLDYFAALRTKIK